MVEVDPSNLKVRIRLIPRLRSEDDKSDTRKGQSSNKASANTHMQARPIPKLFNPADFPYNKTLSPLIDCHITLA